MRKISGIGCGTILAVIVLGVLAYFVLFSCAMEHSQKPVTDKSKYQTIRSGWPSNLVDHFPASLPSAAIFYFHPGFLQGGAALQARVPMGQEQCVALLSDFSSHALAKYYGGDANEHSNMTNGVPTTFFYTSGEANHKFPADYCVIVLVAGTASQWNHGISGGVAVSTQRQEVVYWAESW